MAALAVRHAHTGWAGKDEMRCEKTILPLATQRKHMYIHRVSLLSFKRTQKGTMPASQTSRPCTTLAPHLSDRGYVNS
jgi:hypothetical protein